MRDADGAIALKYESILRELVDKMFYEISVLASSRALYQINLQMNMDHNFPDPRTPEYIARLSEYTSENFLEYYNEAFNILVEEIVENTDADGMLIYLKERGFHLLASDFEKYLFGDDVQKVDFSDILKFISDVNNSVVNESGLFVKMGNDLFSDLVEQIPDSGE
jgi:hypothetical protein